MTTEETKRISPRFHAHRPHVPQPLGTSTAQLANEQLRRCRFEGAQRGQIG